VLRELVGRIYAKNPMQRKRLEPYLQAQEPLFWSRADAFARGLAGYLESCGLGLDYAVDAYLKMCRDTLVEQTRFQRTGCYSCPGQKAAYTDTYANETEMRSYMVGLAVSQFLWANHYAIYAYYLDTVRECAGGVRTYLEIGPGHGMYLAAAMNAFRAVRFRAVDISPVSLNLCRGLLPFVAETRAPLHLEEADALTLQTDTPVDFITMGEVIEHLDDPRPILRKIAALIGGQGRAFLTTCANCPARDHVYLMRSADEIRALLRECGFEIVTERALLADQLPRAAPELRQMVNYAALVRARAA
jgi:2-polyprenyl-3-methyl-5-hydroxy-6-metoxy-1,4-benzoquinol methylase